MPRSLRLLVPAVAATVATALTAALLAGLPSAATGTLEGPAPRPGSVGIGDPYWPLDGNGGIDVQHYDVADRYDFESGVLSGTTTLTLRTTTALSRFDLDLLLPVTSVRVAGVPAAYTKPHPHELQVTPVTPLARGAVVDVEVTYAGDPSGIEYAGERTWLVGAGEVATVNQPHMAPWWFAANDHPRDKATFDVTVTGPATHQVLSNGRPVSRTVTGSEATTHWRSVHPMTTYNAFFALGRYDVELTTRDGLPSYVAVSRGLPASERRTAMVALRRSDDVTAWLANRLGRYPFESTGGVVTSLTVGFALENQTRPVYPGTPSTSLLVHELAHQWFGDSVSLHGWRDIWLNEGFATFMEIAYAERHGGKRAQDWLRQARDDQAASPWFWTVDLTNPGRARVFDHAIYDRGAMALQALRHRIGERRFWRLLRTWVRVHRYGNATVGSFRTLAEKVADQQLDGFFRAWLRAPRPPAATRANGLRGPAR